MANISKIVSNPLKPYTKNGCRLLHKKFYLVSDFTPKSIIPKNCFSIDYVKAETHFGKGESTIITFKDKYGKLIKRVFTQKTGENETEKLVKTFKKDDDVTFVSSELYKNRQKIMNREEAIYLHKVSGKKGMTRIKLDMIPLPDGSRLEKQVYEQLAPKTRGKFIETSALRLKDGTLTKKTINTSHIALTEEFAKDPYLYIRNYNKRDFAKSAALYAEERQGTKGLKGKFIDENLTDFGIYENYTKDVHVDSSQGNKIDIVNTINHEYRHKMQYHLISKLQRSIFNIFVKPEKRIVFKPKEKRLAFDFWFAGMKYPVIFNKGRLYRNNLLEVDARKAGKRAEKEYRFWSDKLSGIFGIPKQMVHNKTLEDTLKELLNKVTLLRNNIGLN